VAAVAHACRRARDTILQWQGQWLIVEWLNHCELIGPVNRRLNSQWPWPHDLVTVASALSLCAYKTSGDDGRYRRRPVSALVVVSLQRYDDVDALSSCHGKDIETTSSWRHRRLQRDDVDGLIASSFSQCQHHRPNDDVISMMMHAVDNMWSTWHCMKLTRINVMRRYIPCTALLPQ